MKTARLLAMATGGLDVGIELEAPTTRSPRGRGGRSMASPVAPSSSPLEQRSHSRSASWSFTRGQVLNPITPITSVLTGIVPSLGQISMSATNTTANPRSIPESPPPSRTGSRESLLVRGSGADSGGGDGEREHGESQREGSVG